MARSGIEIVHSDPAWPREFRVIAGDLRSVLEQRALRIDHIGSTSVPGLAAKDIIDVQVTVAALHGDLEQRFRGFGFGWRPHLADMAPSWADVADDELVKRVAIEREGERPTNIHIRVAGRFNQRYALLFRDFLRANAYAAIGYGETKRALAALVGSDREAYYAVKQPVFDLLFGAAEAWARDTAWEPGPSDA